jgi:hypothetical protein
VSCELPDPKINMGSKQLARHSILEVVLREIRLTQGRCSKFGSLKWISLMRWPIEATITTRELNEGVEDLRRHALSS